MGTDGTIPHSKVQLSWKGKTLDVELTLEDDFEAFRWKVCALTAVLPVRQRYFGIAKKVIEDGDLCCATLGLGTKTKKVQMVGNPEEDLVPFDPSQMETDFVDDNDNNEAEVAPELREENLKKLNNRIETTKVEELNPAREGKRLLVLDVDYTLFDHLSSVESTLEQTRPFLHEFLRSAYAHYDIVIWSATSMKWVELKCREMGMLEKESDYKLRFLLDERPMITIYADHRGKKRVHRVKPLEFIWRRFPMYTAANTIMFDDCSHNFALNKQSGLKIKPFANCHVARATDQELLLLASYLELIARTVPDFRELNHSKWKQFVGQSK